LEIRAKISLAVDKFKTNAAVVGGIWKGMTNDGQKHSAAVDGFIQKSLKKRIDASNNARVVESRNLIKTEKDASDSYQRLERIRKRASKENTRAQFGAVDSTKARDEWLKANLMQSPVQKMERKALPLTDITARKRAEADYTKWWQQELKKRDYEQFLNSGKFRRQLVREDKKMWVGLLKEKAAISRDANRAERRLAWNSLKTRTSEELKNSAYLSKAYIKEAKVNADWKIAQFKREIDYRLLFDKQAKASAKASMSGEEFTKALSRTRYAMYEIGTKLTAAGVAIAGALGAAIMKAAEFESAFTRVERTSGVAGVELDKLKESLMAIATTSPVSYEEITKVATLGAQMGIAADSLDRFTQTVVQFSAITGVSVEEVAQAFGRLGQLLDVPASKFENLSSAITFVGVNAVATDREILTMAESISAAANQAGFAADEVVGLSGALASLKVRPEEARGVIVRLFREIDSSVSEGGTRIADFAGLMGKTSEEAQALWKQDPSQFFTSFLVGAKASGDLNGAITALGITNSRELNVIQRLANNTDVLASTMQDAHEQYLLATYASDAYAKVQDDLKSKMTIFQNVVEQLAASFGDTLMAPMKAFMDMVIAGGKFLNSWPGPLKLVLTIIAALAAGFLLFKGTMLIAMAGMLALRTAMNGLGVSSVKGLTSMQAFRMVAEQVGITGAKSGTMLNIFSLGILGVDRAAKVAAVGARLFAGSMILVQKALPALMILTLIGTAIAVVADMMNSASKESQKLGASMIEAGGGAEELRAAMLKDTAVYEATGKAIGKLRFEYDEAVVSAATLKEEQLAAAEFAAATEEGIRRSTVATGKIVDAKQIDADAQAKLNKVVKEGNDLLGEQELALGANTAAFVSSALTKYGEEQKNFFEEFTQSGDKAKWEAAGFNIAEFIAAGLAKDGGATEYLGKIREELIALTYELPTGEYAKDADKVTAAVEGWGKAYNKTEAEITAMANALNATDGEFVSTLREIDGVAKAIDGMRDAAKAAAAAAELQKNTLIEQGYSADAAADMVEGLSEQLKKYLTAASANVNATGKVYDAFQQLAQGIKDTGGSMDIFGEEGRTNMQNWQNFMVASLEAAEAAGTGFAGGIERIAGGLIALEEQGYDTGDAFEVMTEYIANAAAGKNYTQLATNIRNATDPSQLDGIINNWILLQDKTTEGGKAAIEYGNQLKIALTGGGYAKLFLQQWLLTNDATNKTATNVKTILDYASELGAVLKEAIDIKFSRTNGLIVLNDTMADINSKLKEARLNVIQLQATLSEKKNEKDQLQMDLGLAQMFGDTAGAERIAAEIAGIDAELVKAQEDLAYNVGITSGSLDVNTQAGRDNIKTIQGLIGANAEYIQGLAAGGAGQDELKKEVGKSKAAFVAQLKAMGLSSKEIEDQSNIFDGFIKVVKKVPKDVTVGANTDPAQQALDNFIAKANAAKATATLDLKLPTKEERLKILQDEKKRLQGEIAKLKKMNTPFASGQLNTYYGQVDSIDKLITSGQYADGGLIGGFGGNKQDNQLIKASRSEFVMQSSAVRAYGVDFMNAVNQQRLPMATSGASATAASSSGQVVYLSSKDRELLQSVMNRPITLRTTNRVIAESANDGNKELARRGKN